MGPARVVLVVEDDPDIQEILKEQIEKDGFQVHTADHGKAALDLLARIPPPDLILMDMIMPVMNGWQLSKAIAADARLSSIPIIAMSAAEDHMDEIKACAVFTKPMNLKALLDSIRKHAERA